MKKYMRVYAKVDLDAIYQNAAAVRKKIGDDVGLMAVIKADAYGHGAVPVASCLNDIVDGFCVALVEEAVILRRKGISKPLLLLGYTDPYQYPEILKYGISQTIYSYEMAESLSQAAVALNTVVKVHIKLDTGMGRIGFLPKEESVAEIKRIAELPNLLIEGIYTHLAKADEQDREFTKQQMEQFHVFVSKVEKEGINIPLKHAANSAAIMEYPDIYLNQVRSGIVLYGLYPSSQVHKEQLPLTPALELKSQIIHIKELPKGSPIGYGSTYVTEREVTRVATIPVGYGDGYPRSLSNKGRVLIAGGFAPIIGRICMDQFMVDVTDIEKANIGSVVTLVGQDGNASLSIEEVAELSGSFNYEFCCDIGRRIPRVYYRDGKYYKTVNYL